MPTLVGFFAHPDDETVCSGTLARYAREGVRVVLVYATRGEAGQIVDPSLATRETLPQVREEEMRCAAGAIGVEEVIFLTYQDSGMAGTEDNAKSTAFINVDEDEVTGQLVGIIRTLTPQVIITFDPTGGYGHPDHIAIHERAVAAVRASAEATRFPEHGEAWQVDRLVYPVFQRSFFERLREKFVERGLDTSQLDWLMEEGAGFTTQPIDIEVDISGTIDAKFAALKCHRTQFGPDSIFFALPEDEIKPMMSHEYFAVGLGSAPRSDALVGPNAT